MDTRFSVFISHVAEDEAIAVILKNSIERVFLNSEVFVSGRDLRGGEVWAKEIKDKLGKSSIIIALVTDLSCDSNWVLFEAGAGFAQNKTIPLCLEPITVSKLIPPLSLLQARDYNEEGIERLFQDISKINDLRIPSKISGIEGELNKVKEYLSLRNKKIDNRDSLTNKPSILIKNHSVNNNQDEVVRTKIAEMEKMIKKYIINQLSLVDSATYKIPSHKEIESMNLDDLSELGKYANVPFDYFLITRVRIEKMMRHSEDESEWKKINTLKDIETINKDILKYVNLGK